MSEQREPGNYHVLIGDKWRVARYRKANYGGGSWSVAGYATSRTVFEGEFEKIGPRIIPPAEQATDQTPLADMIDIVFDGPPSHESGRFVEVESPPGTGISFGQWLQRDDGYWVLRFARARAEATPPAASDLLSRAKLFIDQVVYGERHKLQGKPDFGARYDQVLLDGLTALLAATRAEAIEPWRAKLAEQCGKTIAARAAIENETHNAYCVGQIVGRDAERERCAKIAEGPWPATELYPADVQFLKKHVAKLIREPTRKGEP